MVVETRNGYAIQWYLPFDDDMGATLGDDLPSYTKEQIKDASPGDRDHYVAVNTASRSAAVQYSDGVGYYWDTQKAATAVLKLINYAIKAAAENTSWPAWAETALANGWTAPKGWKP